MAADRTKAFGLRVDEINERYGRLESAHKQGRMADDAFNKAMSKWVEDVDQLEADQQAAKRAKSLSGAGISDQFSGRTPRGDEFHPAAANPQVATKKCRAPSPADLDQTQMQNLYEAARSNTRFSTWAGSKTKDAGHWANTVTKDWTTPGSVFEGTPGSLLPAQLLDVPWGFLRYEPFRFSEYLPSIQAEGQQIAYLQHTGNTNPAATVAEGAQKPDLAPDVAQKTASFEVIAATMTISKQLVTDFDGVVTTLVHDLGAAIVNEENHQLIDGDGTGSNLLGLLNQPNILTRVAPATTGPDYTDIDVLVEACNDIRVGTSYAVADLIILNPSDWQAIKRIKDIQGRFVLQLVEPNVIGGSTNGFDNIFGVPVGVTTQCPVGNALVVDTKLAAKVVWRWGLEVLYNPWGDYEFQHNLIQYRGEERLGLTVPYPKAVVAVSNLNQGSGWGS